MQKRIHWLIASSFALIGVFIFAFPSISQDVPLTLTPTPSLSRILPEDIYVRSGPSTDFPSVGILAQGNIVFPVSRNAEADWILIRFGRNYGWIRRDLAEWNTNIDQLRIGDITDLTATAISPSATATEIIPTATQVGSWINTNGLGGFIRSGPSTNYSTLGELPDLTRVEPVSISEDGDWVMIRYEDGFAWVSRTIVFWQDDLSTLPIIRESNLTPTLTFTPSNTPTVTQTPSSTLTWTPSATSSSTATATATREMFVTNTPSSVPTETETPTLDAVDAIILTATQLSLDFPDIATGTAMVSAVDFTPSPSATPRPTRTFIVTPSITASETSTVTLTPSVTETSLPTDTAEPTALPTETATQVPPTVEPSDTATPEPTDTATFEPVALTTEVVTEEPTSAPTNTATPEPTETATLEPIALATEVVTEEPTSAPTNTATLEPTETATFEPIALTTEVVTEEPTSTPTNTASPELTAELTVEASILPDETVEVTPALIQPVATDEPPILNETDVNPPAGSFGVPPEFILGGLGILLAIAYIFSYWRGASSSERFTNGFIIKICPVCQTGNLEVDIRNERFLGIPRPRTTVHCTDCRSILREVGPGRWRYAIDPAENPTLYERFNNKVIDEDVLRSFAVSRRAEGAMHARRSPHVTRKRNRDASPEFTDDDSNR